MKVLLVVGFVLAACLLQAEARSIGVSGELPKVLQETMEQSFNCALKIGPKAANIPKLHGIEQMPVDNEALNELWGCIWVKKGIISENADVDGEALEEYLVELFTIFQPAGKEVLDLAHEITNTCKTVHADNYGVTAVKIQNCINGSLQDKLNQA